MNPADIRIVHGLPEPASLVARRLDFRALASIGLLRPPAHVADELDIAAWDAFGNAAADLWSCRGDPWPAVLRARAALVARFPGGWPVPRGLDPYHRLAEPMAWGADVLADLVHPTLWHVSPKRQAEARKAINTLAAFRDRARAGKPSEKRLETALVAMVRAGALPMIAAPDLAA